MVRFVVALTMMVALALALPGPGRSLAGEPSNRVFLRLDIGQHTAPIRRIAADQRGTVVVTASEDKTLRVWWPDGSARSVLRVPVDDGWEGQLYALAVSPDGKYALTGGISGASWDGGSSSVYVFDIEKEATIGRLTGFPGVIKEIVYSSDGRLFAVTSSLGDKQSNLAIYDGASFKPVKQIADPQGSVTALSFDRAGDLATVALDGTLRIYAAPTYDKPRQTKLPGKLPTSVAFSADGERIAIGFADQSNVTMLSTAKMKVMDAPKLGNDSAGYPTAVAWVDGDKGQELIAGGSLTNQHKRYFVRRWLANGRTQDIAVSGDSVLHLVSDGAGGFLFASADPAWGHVDKGGTTQAAAGRDTGDFRDAHSGRLAVSPDGLTVIFPLARDAKTFLRFNAVDRSVSKLDALNDPAAPGPGRADHKVDPEADAKKLGLTDWRNDREPKLKKRKLALEPGEVARSVAALPDNKGFALGSDARLRLFSPSGDVAATTQLPGTAWALAASANGNFIVAWLGDGTIRWYNAGPSREPLAEVLAVFPHPDGERWVGWTPEGFFDHSDNGGGRMVGFHLNDGKRKTQWMEFESGYRVFYASDLVTRRLDPANDAAIADRLMQIGDVRQVVARQPEVRLTEYCLAGASSGPTRGLGRVVSEPAKDVAVPQLAAAGGADCRPVTETVTRGLGRRAPAAAAVAAETAQSTSAVVNGVVTPPSDAGAAPLAKVAEASVDASAVSRSGLEVPADADHVTLRFAIKSADGYGTIRIFRNGGDATEERVTRGLSRVSPAAQASSASSVTGVAPDKGAGTDQHEATIALDEGPNVIDIRVFDKSGMVFGQSSSVTLTRAKPVAAEKAPPPRILLLSAGINTYQGEIPRLVYAKSDALGFADLIRGHVPPPFDAEASRNMAIELMETAATKDGILSGLRKLRDQARSGDLLVIYLSGHGTVAPVAAGSAINSYYFLPNDVTKNNDDTIRAKGVSSADIVDALANLNTPNVLLILDTCHAGEVAGSEFGKIRKEIGNPSLWAASTSVQEAADGFKDSGHGLFYYGISSALARGAGADDDNRVYMDDVRAYLIRQIPRYAEEIKHKQTVVIQSATDVRSGNVAIPLYQRGGS